MTDTQSVVPFDEFLIAGMERMTRKLMEGQQDAARTLWAEWSVGQLKDSDMIHPNTHRRLQTLADNPNFDFPTGVDGVINWLIANLRKESPLVNNAFRKLDETEALEAAGVIPRRS